MPMASPALHIFTLSIFHMDKVQSFTSKTSNYIVQIENDFFFVFCNISSLKLLVLVYNEALNWSIDYECFILFVRHFLYRLIKDYLEKNPNINDSKNV